MVLFKQLSKEIIQTPDAPRAIGTYSQGVIFSDLVFTSGQIPVDVKTGKLISGNFKLEVAQVLNNLQGVLISGGSSLEAAIKLTVFLTDISKFSEVNEIFSDFFPNDPPARSAVEVSALPMNSRIEIEAIGYIG